MARLAHRLFSFPGSASPPVPVLQGDSSSNPALTTLKNKAEHAKPLGLVKTNNPEEFLVVYDGAIRFMSSLSLPYLTHTL